MKQDDDPMGLVWAIFWRWSLASLAALLVLHFTVSFGYAFVVAYQQAAAGTRGLPIPPQPLPLQVGTGIVAIIVNFLTLQWVVSVLRNRPKGGFAILPADATHPGALPVPTAAQTVTDAEEVVRGWIVNTALQVSLKPAFANAAVWGTLLVDIARRAARSDAAGNREVEQRSLAAIKTAFDSEWSTMTKSYSSSATTKALQ